VQGLFCQFLSVGFIRHINGKRGDFLAYGEEEKESSKIESDKPNFLQNKAHRETEETEIKAIARRY